MYANEGVSKTTGNTLHVEIDCIYFNINPLRTIHNNTMFSEEKSINNSMNM